MPWKYWMESYSEIPDDLSTNCLLTLISMGDKIEFFGTLQINGQGVKRIPPALSFDLILEA